MRYKFLGFSFVFSTILLLPFHILAQQRLILPDSTWVSLLPEYERVGKVHRKIFGENYRKEYAYKLNSRLYSFPGSMEGWSPLSVAEVTNQSHFGCRISTEKNGYCEV